MNRRISDLTGLKFDLVIVGGGIFGACAARDAALRGLSVALIEQGDFGSGTSEHSFKIIHSGIRYLQHADFARLRASSLERNAWLRMAPHLVSPLPVMIPTYGRGKLGKTFLGAGMMIYDLLTLDRNRGIRDETRKIPQTRFLTPGEVLAQFPDLPAGGLTGAWMFHDAQVVHPARLVISVIRTALEKGARAVNHCEVINFLRAGRTVEGVLVRDKITGNEFEVRAGIVLNAAGPWAEPLLEKCLGIVLNPRGVYSRDVCFVVSRRFAGETGLALLGRTRDPDAVFSRSRRHLFLVPWREYALTGVWHQIHNTGPDQVAVSRDETRLFFREFHDAFPAFNLTPGDIRVCHAGLVPFGRNRPGAVNLSYGKRSILVDHEIRNGIGGLVTLIGIRFTMARCDAALAVDRVAGKLGFSALLPEAVMAPVMGGCIPDFEAFVKDRVAAGRRLGMSEMTVRDLCRNYGTEARALFDLAAENPEFAMSFDGTTVLKAEVPHAVRCEMALTLDDIVFRRTGLAAGGHPGDQVLKTCADMAAKELHWDDEETKRQLKEVYLKFPREGCL